MSSRDRVQAVFEIDGRAVTTLEEFFDEISHVLIPGASWGRNLDAFNDILRGGFRTPKGGFTLRWSHHTASRRSLGTPKRPANWRSGSVDAIQRIATTSALSWLRLRPRQVRLRSTGLSKSSASTDLGVEKPRITFSSN